MSRLKRNSFIIISILLLIFVYEKIDYKSHEYIIDNIYKNDNVYNKLNYMGYIEIKKLNIKREIVYGINSYNLLNHVATNSSDLESDNIVVAGHAIKNIFGNLNRIQLNDIVKISTYKNNKYYKVFDVEIVDKNDIDIIDNSNLILITCINFNKRLIVKAKRI